MDPKIFIKCDFVEKKGGSMDPQPPLIWQPAKMVVVLQLKKFENISLN